MDQGATTMSEYTPTTADELEAIVYEAARANVSAQVPNPYEILAAWLAAHDAEVAAVERERCAQIAEDVQHNAERYGDDGIAEATAAQIVGERIRAVPAEQKASE